MNSDKKAVGMTFSDDTLQVIMSRLQLPAAFSQMLAPDQIEPPRFSHNTLFDTHGNHLGMGTSRFRLLKSLIVTNISSPIISISNSLPSLAP